ncbi:carbohydrate kinase family protein [Jannaschia formosa]|uniref:carbohydrate kinase family protein n=1 Tax=Jannaschia formosa TaxID=2259592 RepID=UPI000E1C2079|nr:carbohydrate kinase family protein [Jannaschia formosa]TFL18328.1 carbohydrate kinase family protein [Jannaschia formosa]
MSRDGVLCVGRVYCDLVFTGLPRMPTPGTETFAGGLTLHPGGGAAITAAYLAALGRPAFLAAHLPAAPFDTGVADRLAALGVDLSFCAPATSPEPQMTVAMVQEGERAFLTRDAGDAVPPLDAGALRGAGIGHLHVGELKTLVERPDLLDLAEAAGLTVSLDCGWDDGVTAAVAPLIARADLFLPNAEEMARLEALGLQPRGRVATVIKMGAEGSALPGAAPVPAPEAESLDTTGAGDAFNGGFVDAWLSGAALEACQRAGNACGALAVAHAGGTAGAVKMRSLPTSAARA